MSRLVGPSYQYLQRGKIPTDKFQKSLPRLKIPSLDKTCQRYLAALEPIFSGDQRLDSAKKALHEFQNGPGKDLHTALLQYDKTQKHTSYINEFWFNMYLSSRSPLPLNFNPFLAWRDASNTKLNNQIVRSANFLISAIRFKRSLEENVLEPEIFHLNPKKTAKSSFYKDFMRWTPESIATYVSFAFKAFPLDMSQYKNLFNSTRIPRNSKDEILKSDSVSNRHVLVIKNGRFYTFDVIDHNGDIKSPELIYASLEHIANLAARDPCSADTKSITELTTADRNFWASEREHLLNLSEKNQRNMSRVDSAIFAICLDDVMYEESQKVEGAHNFLHGSNPKGPINRWFDKSFSIIVTKDGHSSINFEHSWGDGVAILRFFNETFYDTDKSPHVTGPIEKPCKEQVQVEQLDFDLDSRIESAITKARVEHLKITADLELGAIEYSNLDRNYFKRNKLSPDAMSQLAFQLAYKKLYKHTPVTYESCSTAAFRGGRTETVRPCTNQTNTACEDILANSKSQSELKVLLQKASSQHYQLCKEASMGDGFDRHLFSLKEIAVRRGGPLPALFQDPIYNECQQYVVSTSTLYGECFSGGGFAPVVPNGFGLGYGYVDENFGVLVSSYRKHRNNSQFVQALTESLDEIRKIVET